MDVAALAAEGTSPDRGFSARLCSSIPERHTSDTASNRIGCLIVVLNQAAPLKKSAAFTRNEVTDAERKPDLK
jgi:hypothetical protein